MVESADERRGDEATMIGWLDLARLGSVLVEGEMAPEPSTCGAQESEYEGHCAPASLGAIPSSSVTIEFWQTTGVGPGPLPAILYNPLGQLAAAPDSMAERGRRFW